MSDKANRPEVREFLIAPGEAVPVGRRPARGGEAPGPGLRRGEVAADRLPYHA